MRHLALQRVGFLWPVKTGLQILPPAPSILIPARLNRWAGRLAGALTSIAGLRVATLRVGRLRAPIAREEGVEDVAGHHRLAVHEHRRRPARDEAALRVVA